MAQSDNSVLTQIFSVSDCMRGREGGQGRGGVRNGEREREGEREGGRGRLR